MFGLNKKALIAVGLSALLVFCAIMGIIVIPNAVGRFRPLSDMPTHRETVSGNGGNAVMVGGYLFFTSGFVSNSAATLEFGQNEFNRVRGEGSIWRLRMPTGFVNYDNSHLEDWDIYGALAASEQQRRYGNALNHRVAENDLRLVVPKIAGWEQSAMWVFGSTLVYTSPNNQRDRHGQLRRNNIDFFRVDIDGRNHRRIYSTDSVSVMTGDFTVVSIDGAPILLVHDGRSLVSVDMRGRVTTISEEVIDAVLPHATGFTNNSNSSFANTFAGMMGYVFFTESADEDNISRGGTLLRRHKIGGGADATVTLRHDHSTYRLIELGNGNLIFEVTTAGVRRMYAVDEVNDDFSESGLHRFLLPHLLQQEEVDVFVSGERTARANFFYITPGAAGTLAIRERVNGFNARTIPNIDDFQAVIEITPSTIKYRSIDGAVRITDFQGRQVNTTPAQAINPVLGSRVTAFNVLNSEGLRSSRGSMFFYIREMHQQDGEGEETTTVGVLVDRDGVSHIIARLDYKFIPPAPQNPPQRD